VTFRRHHSIGSSLDKVISTIQMHKSPPLGGFRGLLGYLVAQGDRGISGFLCGFKISNWG
jgi:hypothetical protein